MREIGKLYCCASPIGNLQDASQRLIDTLKAVDLIVAEDTRVTKKLCQAFDIQTPIQTMNAHNEKPMAKQLIEKIQAGQSVAMLSDAGTPLISDPGAFCLRQLIESGITIVPISGPSAVTTLLSASGLAADSYIFCGFFPRKAGEASDLLNRFRLGLPVVFFESPKRLLKTAEYLSEHYPEAQCVFGKELTKKFETLYYGTALDCYERLKNETIKGEWCFAIHLDKNEQSSDLDDALLKELLDLGLSQKDIQKVTTHLNWPKKKVYERCLSLSK